MKKIILFILLIFMSACEINEQEFIPPIEPVVEEPAVIVLPEAVEPTPEPEIIEEEVDDEEIASNLVKISFEEARLIIGKLGILSNNNMTIDLSFAQAYDYEIFNQYNDLIKNEYDTHFIIYQEGFLQFYPPMNWGVNVLERGQILVIEHRGIKVILAHFPPYEEKLSLFKEIDLRILLLTESTTVDEYMEWQRANPIDIDGLTPPSIFVDPDLTLLDNLDICRLETRKIHRDGSQLGFPYVRPFIPNQGTLNVLVVPIDFSNAKGDPLYLNGLTEDVKTIERWADFFSNGKLQYNVNVIEEWTTYEKGYEYFPDYTNANFNSLQDPQITKVEVVELISEKADITDVDFFYLIFPREHLQNRKTILYGKSNLRLTNNQNLTTSFYGNENFSTTIGSYWNHLLHEVLHFQGFVGHGPGAFGSSYTIMNNADDGAMGIMAWEGFLVDWLGEDDIGCIAKESLIDPYSISLESIDEIGASSGIKSLMIPLNQTKIMIIEYRSSGEWSNLSAYQQGIIVYIVDISKESLYPRGPRDQRELDKVNFWYHLYSQGFNTAFRVGQEAQYENVLVKIIGKNTVEVSLVS